MLQGAAARSLEDSIKLEVRSISAPVFQGRPRVSANATSVVCQWRVLQCLKQPRLITVQQCRDFLAEVRARLPKPVNDSAKHCLIHVQHLGQAVLTDSCFPQLNSQVWIHGPSRLVLSYFILQHAAHRPESLQVAARTWSGVTSFVEHRDPRGVTPRFGLTHRSRTKVYA